MYVCIMFIDIPFFPVGKLHIEPQFFKKSVSPVVWDKAVFGAFNGEGSILTKGFYSGVNILSFQWISYPGTITSFLDVKGRITVLANHQG